MVTAMSPEQSGDNAIAGLQLGDQILRIADRVIPSVFIAQHAVEAIPWPVATHDQAALSVTVPIAVQRDGQEVVVEQVLRRMPIPGRAYHGMRLRFTAQGAKIDSVTAGSPAALAGVKEGQVLSQVNGTVIHKRIDWLRFLSDKEVGDWLHLICDNDTELSFQLMPRP